MVGRVLADYRPALIRDLRAMGLRATDMFTERLTFYELTCIIIASPPDSSVRYFLDGGWSLEAQLMANMQEQQRGFSELSHPYERPGTSLATDANPFGGGWFKADSMDWDEFTIRERERYANAEFTPAEGVRSISAGRFG
jgi:hypothetical protein